MTTYQKLSLFGRETLLPREQVIVELFRSRPGELSDVEVHCCPFCFHPEEEWKWKKAGDDDFGPYRCPECGQRFRYFDKRNLLDEFLTRALWPQRFEHSLPHIAERHDRMDDPERQMQDEAAAAALELLADEIVRLRVALRDAGVMLCERCEKEPAAETLCIAGDDARLCKPCFRRFRAAKEVPSVA